MLRRCKHTEIRKQALERRDLFSAPGDEELNVACWPVTRNMHPTSITTAEGMGFKSVHIPNES